MRFKLGICALMVLSATMVLGQVASHTPTIKTTKSSAAAASTQNFIPKPVARVNGTTLTEIDLVREMYAMFPYSRQHNGFPKSMEPEMRRGALEMIIFQELLYQDAKRRNMSISASQLSQAEAQFRKQFSSKAEYQDFLRVEAGDSPAVMREKIRRSLLIEKMLKVEVTEKATPSLAEVRAYYDKNPSEFTHPELLHIQSISIIPPKGSNRDVLEEAKHRAEDAVDAARKTTSYESFGLLAEKISDDDFHVNMGDHKELSSERFPPEIVSRARAMKAGQVSDLIKLGANYTVFRLVELKQAGKTPLAEAKAQIFTKLKNEKTEQIRSTLNKSLQKNAKIERL